MRPRGKWENGLRIWAIGLLMSMMVAGHVFAQAAVAPSNPEMARIFSEDQSDRSEELCIRKPHEWDRPYVPRGFARAVGRATEGSSGQTCLG